MSTQIIAVVVIILVQLLPKLGITVDSASLTSTIQTIVSIVAGLWIWYQRVTKLKRVEHGNSDVTPLGARKH
jgi:uncharacterized membrane protein